jgi:hypothetical protein
MQTSRACGYLALPNARRAGQPGQKRGGFWASGKLATLSGDGVRLLLGAPGAPGAQVSHCRGTDWIGDARRGSGVGQRRSAVSGGQRFRRPRALDQAR